MGKKEKDIAFFVAFCIEEYRAAKGMTGEEAIALFAKYGVTDYLSECFEPLHTGAAMADRRNRRIYKHQKT